MRSREDLAAMIREAQKHPKADLLFEIGLEGPNPTKAAQRAQREGLSNGEEKLAKWVAVFKRDHGEGWFEALREILENPEEENQEMGLTKTQRKALESVKEEDVQNALDILMKWGSGDEFVTLKPVLKPVFDPRKVKEEHLRKYMDVCGKPYFLPDLLGMDFETALEHIPNPEPGHENYLLVVNCLPLAKLMRFVAVDGERGFCLINENEIQDKVDVPKTLFYWRYDIDDGSATLGKKPEIAKKILLKAKRQGLTVREAVCLLMVNPDILKSHDMWAIGSRHGAGNVASLWLFEGKPELDWSWARYSAAGWGSASCSSS